MREVTIIGLIVVAMFIGAGMLAAGVAHVADVTGPQAQASADAARLDAENAALRERIRIETLAKGEAKLELDKKEAIQEQEKAAAIADIQVNTAQRISSIIGAIATGIAWTIFGVIVLSALSVTTIITVPHAVKALGTAMNNKALTAGWVRADPETMRLPAGPMRLPNGRTVIVNMDAGQVFDLEGQRVWGVDKAQALWMFSMSAAIGTARKSDVVQAEALHRGDLSAWPGAIILPNTNDETKNKPVS